MYAQYILRPTLALFLGYGESTNKMGQQSFIFRPRDLNDTSYIFILLNYVWARDVIYRAGILTRVCLERLSGFV